MKISSFHSRILRLFVVLMLIILPSVGPASAAQDGPDTPVEQEYATWPPRPLPSDPSMTQPAEGFSSLPIIPDDYECEMDSKAVDYVAVVVFSAYVPQESQYDLFYQPICSSSGSVQITHTAADEVFPHFDQDTSQVVFVSDATGNDEIFKINVDGSGLAQLTFDGAVDTYPVFSPDGTQIAFVSDRAGGNADVYIMSSGGGTPRRVTTSPAFDVHPDWSPDGKKIAWARRSGSMGDLYTMNADGSSGETFVVSLRYGGHPSWSADGSKLMFDYDSSGDGWLDIGLINSDGSGMSGMPLLSASYNADITWGSWYGRAGEEGFVYSIVYYTYQNRRWYVSKASLFYGHLTQPYISEFSINTGALGFAFYPHAELFDHTPPQLSFDPLPTYSSKYVRGRLNVKDMLPVICKIEFSTNDDGYWRNLRLGESQPNENGEGFIDFFFDNTSYKAQSVSFRVSTAYDKGNNAIVENSGPVTSTKLYTWHVTPRVQDPRETPLDGAVIDAGENAFDQPVETIAGVADLYYFNQQIEEQDASITKPAFAAKSARWPIGMGDGFLTILPPANNLIANGEMDDISSWEKSGTLPVGIQPGQYNDQAVQLGLSCYHVFCFAPSRIIHQTDAVRNLSIVLDALGGGHYFAGTRYYYSSPSGVWSERESLLYTFNGPFGVLPDGRPYAFSRSSSGAEYIAVMSASGNWTYKEFGTLGSVQTLVSDAQGQLHVIYHQHIGGPTFYKKCLSNGVWQDDIALPYALYSSLQAIATDDGVHIVYSSDGAINYFTISPLGVASEITTFTGISAPVKENYSVQLAVDPAGNVHLVADGHNYFHFWSRSPEGVWSAPQSDPAPVREADTGVYKAVFDKDGKLHIFGNERYGDSLYKIYEMLKTPGVSGYSFYKLMDVQFPYAFSNNFDITIDSNGFRHIIWSTTDTTFNYQKQQNITGVEQASLSQTVSLPADMHEPTLSFFYKLNEAGANTQPDFRVLLTPQGGSPVTIFQADGKDEAPQWRHAWFDLNPWLGQTVNLAFVNEQSAAGNAANVIIDEVSVGGWTTPILTAFTPARVNYPYTANAWVEITGANLMDGVKVWFNNTASPEVDWISDTTIRCRVPAGLTVGEYRIRLENPGGVTSAFTQRFQVGQKTFLPLLARK